MSECKYCKNFKENSIIWNTHTLYFYKEEGGYVNVMLDNVDNKSEQAAKIIVESGIDDKYNRVQFEIYYCPMCGRKLGG